MGCLGQHDGELFTPVARSHIGGPGDCAANDTGNVAQAIVSGHMSVMVVEQLEVIHVEEDER
jgi:hypothetical protein